MKKSVFIVGIGMDGKRTITVEAEKIIEQCGLLIGASRMLMPFEKNGCECFASYNYGDIHKKISECSYEKIAVLVSGDCGFYSMAQKLKIELGEFNTELICGISSPIYFCSRLGISWQDMKFISLHGIDNCIVRHVASNEKCFFLLGGKITASDICRKLIEYGMDDIKVCIGENLSLDNERITVGMAAELKDIQTDNLCVLVTENYNCERYMKYGIADDEFIRGKVPMTKSEIRNAAVSKLNIPSDGICWDIGCGTGSVSVEMAMQCPDGCVYSVDKNLEAVELTSKNSHNFKCDNIKTALGQAPDILSELPAPDCVFIGGSCGKIEGIMNHAFSKNRNARIVITAVSLETVNGALSAFEKFEIQPDIVQITVANTRKIGSHTMLNGENPVFIISGGIKRI